MNIINYLKKNHSFNFQDYVKQNKFFPYHIFFVIVYAIIYYTLSKTNMFYKEEGDKFNTFFDCFTYSLLLHFTIGPIFTIPPNTNTFKAISISQVLLAYSFMRI